MTIRTIRHYHQRGLLAEPARDASGYRRYEAQAVIDLIRIRTLADAGVPLACSTPSPSRSPRPWESDRAEKETHPAPEADTLRGVTDVDLAPLAAAAGAALSRRFGPVTLTGCTRLPGSDRAHVFRAQVSAARGAPPTVIVKAPTGSGAVREPAALRVLGDAGVGGVPEVLAETDELLVMADVGTGHSLADRLRGDDPEAATAALIGWAEAVARLQASTVGLGSTFAAALADRSPLGPPPVDTADAELAAAAAGLATNLPRLGVTPGSGALAAIRALASGLAPAGTALDPGDACPDNNLETPDGLILLDFEWAEFRHVGWVAAYLRVPWPTCWCSWRMPDEVTDAALGRWRRTLAPTLPSVASGEFAGTLGRLTAAWAFLSMEFFLARAIEGDPPSPDPDRQRPGLRALLQHRLAAIEEAPVPAEVSDLAAETLAATRRTWGDRPLDVAPAWR